ncbi:proton-conducting transporter transmembrane domain-containing protein [Streptomyces sp. 8L]|uniref:proton-conducting transporter transmembrane domain-containing protein n=1 Tax=Streptomyces sp. 8L TaxID=2877242 RepID=UPI001CD27969|nr:proton-conducting transporter membrane subunit [Streptomyces sp. 8L]MCA1217764.1 hydrogenase 4 subunit B [Streptomyces sp. 8L]
MSVIGPVLGAGAALAGAGALAGAFLPGRARVVAVGWCGVLVGVSGAVAGGAALGGARWALFLPDVLPPVGVRLGVDALSGLFMAVAGVVVCAVSLYGIGYAGHGGETRGAQAALPVFAATLVLVPAAAGVSTFLALWEVMAVSSLLLVLAEHRQRPEVASAGLWYAVMTHLGLVALLAALSLFAAHAGGESFTALRAAAGGMPPGVRDTVFVLALAAFGSKMGMAPLHAWLPRAHPEAPSNVSALMSAAMVNLGVYGLVRVGFDLLGGGPRWWWLLTLAAGALSAVYGILQAAVAHDLKRLLAYSTGENMGLVLVGTGAAGLFETGGEHALAVLALTAALLHVVNHSAFKALLFCAAGSVLRSTGVRDLDLLGGLRARMPVTAALFALGALGAVALPPGGGFISEWLLFQSLIHGLAVPGLSTAVLLPVAVAAVALSAGLAAAVFVKALGVGFFARAGGEGPRRAAEAPPTMLAGMAVLGVWCVGLALVPQLLAGALARAASAAGLRGGRAFAPDALRLRLAHFPALFSPLWLAVALVAGVLAVSALARLAGRRRRRAAPVWDCGGGSPTPRMAYTATSFAEPLQRVFDDVLAPEHDVDITHVKESRYLVARARYATRVTDRVEHRLYTPVFTAMGQLGVRARRLAPGSAHVYLGYGFLGLVVLLAAVAVAR